MGFAKIMSGNLKPFRKGEARAVECGRLGGIASGASRRRSVFELLQAELDQEFCGGGLFNNEATGITKRAQMVKALVDKATQGDPRAFALILKVEEMAGASVPEA